MAKYKIGILLGDDIGLEVVPEAVKILRSALNFFQDVKIEWSELPIGYNSYLETGETLPASTLESLYGLDGWILGPIGHRSYPKNDPKAINPHPILRKKFELHSNIRPSRSFSSIPSIHQNVDLIIVRENNEGFQPDRNVFAGSSEFMPTPDIAISTRVITRNNSEFVASTAFELARQRKKKVTAVHKNTVFKLGCGLFAECCRNIAQKNPDVEFEELIVDTFALHLVMHPQNFDVVVTTNMFGDILSDEAAGLVGGLGMAPGLCVGPKYAMAQATHGSAPDIAGKNIANPFALIISIQMLLEWLGNKKKDRSAVKAAKLVQSAVEQVIVEKTNELTPDLGGLGTTNSMGDTICAALETLAATR